MRNDAASSLRAPFACCDFFTGLASVLQPLALPAKPGFFIGCYERAGVSPVQRVAILLPLHTLLLRRRRRRFAGGGRGSRFLQFQLNIRCERVLATKHAPRGPFRLLECRHGFAEIVERGAVVLVERHRVTPTHPERELMILSEDASCHGHCFAQQRTGFFEALLINEGHRVIVGRPEGTFMFFAIGRRQIRFSAWR